MSEAYNIIFASVGDAQKGHTEPMLLQDQLETYEELLDAVVRQAAVYKAALDNSISRGMRVTNK